MSLKASYGCDLEANMQYLHGTVELRILRNELVVVLVATTGLLISDGGEERHECPPP